MMRSLVELSQKVLIRHLDSIREFGDIPTHLVVPILAAANANQLLTIEKYNPHILNEIDNLWKPLVLKDFAQFRIEYECSPDKFNDPSFSWREKYRQQQVFMKERSERIAEKLRSTYRSEQAEKNKRKLVVLEQPPKIQRARRWGEPYKKPTVLSKIKRELSTHSSSAAPLSLTSSAVGGSSRSGSSSYVTDLGDKVKPHSSEDRISREDLEQSSALASAEFFKTSSSIAATSNSTTKSKPALTTTTSSLFLPKAKRAK